MLNASITCGGNGAYITKNNKYHVIDDARMKRKTQRRKNPRKRAATPKEPKDHFVP